MRRGWIIVLSIACTACTFGTEGQTAGEPSLDPGTTGGERPSPPGTTPFTTGESSAGSGEAGSNGVDDDAGNDTSTSIAGVSDGGTGSDSAAESTSGSDTEGAEFVLCDPYDPELRGCYDFADVESGTLADLSSYGNHGTAAGLQVQPGPFGDAVRFSTDVEVAVPDSASLDLTLPLTFEAWVWLDSIPSAGRVGIIDRDGQYSLLLFADTGLRCNAGTSAFAAELPIGQWMHVACVNDGSAMSIYVDGQLVQSVDGTAVPNTGNVNVMSIGDTSPGFTEPMDGMIGALRFWSVALDAEQIAAAAATVD